MGALYPDSGGRFLLVRLLCLASRLRNKSQAKHSSVINGTLLQPSYGLALVFVAPIFLARRQREAQKIVEQTASGYARMFAHVPLEALVILGAG